MRYVNYLGYAALPLAFLVHFLIGHGKSWEPTVTFILAAVAVIPMAHMMGEATEHLAERTGPTWGGLINATFGNAAELIIAVIALSKGLNEVVKASLTGSILGNLLLVGGAAMVVGGWKREKQTFSRNAAEANSGLLVVAVAAMMFPAIFHHSYQLRDPQLVEHEHGVSVATSIILIAVYGLGLLFTLRTHAHIFSPNSHAGEPTGGRHAAPSPAGGVGVVDYEAAPAHPAWTVKKSIIMLLIASAGIGIVAELLVGSAEKMAHNLGWNAIFVGVVLLAIIGNAAEHSTALLLAKNDDMNTAMTITYQSSLQIALFATPFLVLLSWVMVKAGWVHPAQGAPQYLDMVFSPMEVAAVVLTVGIVVVLGMNGETNWFEGVLLLAMYCILGIAFFYIPEAAAGGYHDAAGGATTAPSGIPVPHP